MYVREKTARGHTYLYLVESVREGGRVRQQIVRALGRKDALIESGELDRLIASLARHSERSLILSDMESGRIACRSIGGPLLFGRLWERLGIGEILFHVSKRRKNEWPDFLLRKNDRMDDDNVIRRHRPCFSNTDGVFSRVHEKFTRSGGLQAAVRQRADWRAPFRD